MSTNKILFIFSFIVIADIATSLAYSLNFRFWNFGVLVKTPIELYLLIIYFKPNKLNNRIFAIVILFLFWIIGISATIIQTNGVINVTQANFINDDKIVNPLIESFLVFNRYIFFFVLASILFDRKNDEKLITGCKKILELFFLINSLAIIIGYLFKIKMFSSYDPKGAEIELRFGYKGLLYGTNEISGVYFLGIAYLYRDIFYLKRKRILFILLVAGSAFLTGTKGSVIALILLSVYYFSKYKPILFLLFFIPLIYFGYLYLNAQSFENLKNIANINFNSDSIVSFLMTGRDVFVIKNFNYMNSNWNLLNYLFGDGVLYSETDLLDLYYMFGLGGIIYLRYYLKILFSYGDNRDFMYIIMLLMIIACTGGHIIRSAVFPYFFCLYLVTGITKPNKLSSVKALLKK